MNSNNYVSHPAGNTGVELPQELLDLAETISKDVQENWLQSRMNEGWKYGSGCDDEKRTAPCLVPYEELPEEE